MFRTLLRFIRPFHRIALALESIVRLYRLDLESRGLTELKPGLRDQVELSYDHRSIAQDELED